MRALDVALEYVEAGWAPIPIPHCEKNPARAEWQNWRITAETAPQHFNGQPQNVGVLMGEPSGWLVDVDLDAVEAIQLADRFLPPSLTFGRASKWRSHRLYTSKGAKTLKRQDPKDRAMLVELRSTGCQTVFPGSTHTSGEAIVWDLTDVALPELPADDLTARVGRLAAASLLGKHWPANGRHEAQLALAGGLLTSGVDDDTALEILCAVCAVVGDEDREKRRSTIESTRRKINAGEPCKGWRSLGENVDRDVVSAARTWLGAVDSRPQIRVVADLGTMVDSALFVVAQACYQRAGRLVRVVPADPSVDRSTKGTPTIREHTRDSLREVLARGARWVRVDADGETKPAQPPATVVGALLDRADWPGVPGLAGVVDTPVLRPDGSVASAHEFDGVTGLLHVPGETFPEVPEHPSRDAARRALLALREPFTDFPWRDGCDRDALVAVILTVLGRAAIDGPVPGVLVDANTPGSGKSLSLDCALIVANGLRCGRASWPHDDTELEKVLSSYALSGAGVIVLDNIDQPVRGGPLDKVLTAGGRVDLRVLGRSEIQSLPWRALVVGSGNNLIVRGDTVRRVLVPRMVSPLERPEDREDFRVRDLRAWCRDNRARLVVAGLTLLRAHALADRPDEGVKPLGSFEAWSNVIASAIVWAGGENVLGVRASSGADDSQVDHGRLLELWVDALGEEPLTAGEFMAMLNTGTAISSGKHEERAELRDILVSLSSSKELTARSLGYVLRRLRDRVVGGKTLRGERDTDRNTTVWGVKNV